MVVGTGIEGIEGIEGIGDDLTQPACEDATNVRGVGDDLHSPSDAFPNVLWRDRLVLSTFRYGEHTRNLLN